MVDLDEYCCLGKKLSKLQVRLFYAANLTGIKENGFFTDHYGVCPGVYPHQNGLHSLPKENSASIHKADPTEKHRRSPQTKLWNFKYDHNFACSNIYDYEIIALTELRKKNILASLRWSLNTS